MKHVRYSGRLLMAVSLFCMISASVDQLAQALLALAVTEKMDLPGPEETVIPKDLEDLKESLEIQLIPPTIKLPKDAKLVFTLPIFGKVELRAIPDNKGGYEFIADMPPAEKPIDVGVLKIEKGLFRLAEGKLTYNAFVNFLGVRARVGLKDLSLKKEDVEKITKSAETGEITKTTQQVEVMSMTWGVTFEKDAAVIPLGLGNKIEFKSIDLIMEQGKGIEFKQTSEIFGQNIEVSGLIDITNKKFSLKGDISKRRITDILAELQGTVLDQLSLEGYMLFNFEDGLTIKGKLSGTEQDYVGIEEIKLKNAEIDISTEEEHALVTGETEILGLPLRGYFAVFFGEQKGVIFRAEVEPGVNEWKPFKDIEVKELQEITLHSLQASAQAQYLAALEGEEKEEAEEKKTETITDDYTDTESLIEQIKEKGSEIRGEAGLSFALFISGKSTILNTESSVTVKIDKVKGQSFGATLIAELPEGWKLSQSFPDFKPDPTLCTDLNACVDRCKNDLNICPKIFGNYILSAIDLLIIENARLVLSTRKEIIDEKMIEKGFNLMATLAIDGSKTNNPLIKALEGVIKQVNNDNARLELAGSFDPTSPKTMAFKLGASAGGFGFKLGETMIYGGELNLVIRGEPALGFEGLFKFQPTPNDIPLEFAVEIALTPIKFGFAGSMVNVWKNPFGIQGFEFGNLAVRGTQTYTAVAEAIAGFLSTGVGALVGLVPADFGLAGCVRFGSSERGFLANAQLNLGKDISSLALVADVCDPLSLSLLVEVVLKQLGAQTDLLGQLDKLFPVQLKKAGLKFVPLGTTIGNLKITQGIGGYCYIDLFGKEAHLDFNIGLNGLVAKGQMPAFEIGPLKLTNFDDTCKMTEVKTEKREWGKICDCENPNIRTEQPDPDFCGPQVDIQFNLKEQKFYIDGLLKIGNILQGRTQWYFTKAGTSFDTTTFIGPEGDHLGIRLKGTTIGFALEDLVKLEPKDITLEIEFQDNLRERLLNQINDGLADTQKQIEDDVNFSMEQLSRGTTQKDLDDQQKRVDAARDARVGFFDDPIESIKREIQFRIEEAKSTLLKAKFEIEKTAIGQLAGNIAKALKFDVFGKGVLMVVKEVAVGGVNVGQMVFQDISKLVVLKRIYWKGSLADLGKGEIPGLEVQLCAGCQEIKRTLPKFNLLDPLKSIDVIAGQIVEMVHEVVVATFSGDPCEGVCGVTIIDEVGGNTPLHLAIISTNTRAALSLIEKGEDLDTKNSEGNTPFHLAAQRGMLDVVRELLRKGADPNLGNNQKQKPLLLAHASGHTETAQYLRPFTGPKCQEFYDHLVYWNALQLGPGDPRGTGLYEACIRE